MISAIALTKVAMPFQSGFFIVLILMVWTHKFFTNVYLQSSYILNIIKVRFRTRCFKKDKKIMEPMILLHSFLNLKVKNYHWKVEILR